MKTLFPAGMRQGFCTAGVGARFETIASLGRVNTLTRPCQTFDRIPVSSLVHGVGASARLNEQEHAALARNVYRLSPPPPLSFSRPRGPFKGGEVRDAELLRRHGFVFNRPARMQDLGRITPRALDASDRMHYRREGEYLVSCHNPRFVLADLGRVTRASIIAMLALDRCLVMRVPVRDAEGGQKTLSIFLVADHTWALWGWVEAAARGEIANVGNVLVHIDDHPDLTGLDRKPLMARLSMGNIDRVIRQQVKSREDPMGIASFIAPAVQSGLLRAVLWEYGTKRTRETERLYELRSSYAASIALPAACSLFQADDLESLAQDEQCSFLEDISPHTDHEQYLFPPFFHERFPGWLFAHRSDCFPFESLKDGFGLREDSSLILDIDIDVQDDVEDVARIVRPHLTEGQFPDCITIAMSPEFGAYENHVEKVEALLRLLRGMR